ncbi:MAG: CapA family protein [Nannocystis sp.]|nr:CapA family protein [Nannocystis sp.]
MRRPRSPLLALLAALTACTGQPGLDAEARPKAPSVPVPPPPAPEPAASPPLIAAQALADQPTADAPAPQRSPPEAPLELTFVGDIIFGRYRDDGYDPIPGPDEHPFEEIRPLLAADLVVANLETPLARVLPDRSPIGTIYRFGAAAEMTAHLVDAGISAVSLANNHFYDLRVQGMTETPAILREHGIVPLGAGRSEEPLFRVETLESKGWRVGVIAVSTRRNAPDFDHAPRLPFSPARELAQHLGPLLREAAADHDALLVFIHWGDEYIDEPAKIQQTAARQLIDLGAAAVIGHHPHVLQGLERYKGGLIAYSLGNFLFENTGEIPRLTGVLRLRLAAPRGCIERATFHPAYIKRSPSPHPVPAQKTMGKVVRARMEALSKKLGAALEREGEDLILQGFDCPT